MDKKKITVEDLKDEGLHLCYVAENSLILTPHDPIQKSTELFNSWVIDIEKITGMHGTEKFPINLENFINLTISEIPSAQEFFKKHEKSFNYFEEILHPELYEFYSGVIQQYAIEFAKIHVKEALKNASEKAQWKYSGDPDHIFHYSEGISIFKRSITEAYSFTNIK